MKTQITDAPDTEIKTIYSPEGAFIYSYEFASHTEPVENFPYGPAVRAMKDQSFIINSQKSGSISCIEMPGVLSLEITGRGGEVRPHYGTPNCIGKELGAEQCFYLVTLKDRDAAIVAHPKRLYVCF